MNGIKWDVLGAANIARKITIAPGLIELTIDGNTQTVSTAAADQFQLMVEAFGQAVLEGGHFAYPPADAVANMRAIDALRRAAQRVAVTRMLSGFAAISAAVVAAALGYGVAVWSDVRWGNTFAWAALP